MRSSRSPLANIAAALCSTFLLLLLAFAPVHVAFAPAQEPPPGTTSLPSASKSAPQIHLTSAWPRSETVRWSPGISGDEPFSLDLLPRILVPLGQGSSVQFDVYPALLLGLAASNSRAIQRRPLQLGRSTRGPPRSDS